MLPVTEICKAIKPFVLRWITQAGLRAGLWGPAAMMGWEHIRSSSMLNYALYETQHGTAFVFCVPRDGELEAIGVNVLDRVGAPPEHIVGFYTVAAGYPTDTLYGGCAAESYDFDSTGWHWVTLATPATAVAGDIIAARLRFGATDPDSSNFIATAVYGPVANAWTMLPREMRDGDGGWDYYEGYPAGMAVRYSDGRVYGLALTGLPGHYYDSADSPDEVGCLINPPAAATCSGVRLGFARMDIDTAFDVCYYDAAGVEQRAISVDDPGINEIMGGYGTCELDIHWTPVALAPGCRVTVKATDPTRRVMPGALLFESAASKAAIPHLTHFQMTERTNAGAWTDTERGVVWMGLHLD